MLEEMEDTGFVTLPLEATAEDVTFLLDSDAGLPGVVVVLELVRDDTGLELDELKNVELVRDDTGVVLDDLDDFELVRDDTGVELDELDELRV